ncbi:MAG: reductive dehalogenase [Proteobacteria bacterium]|nr:reductive dehalogenase [Pseudomonadota bacterium]
MAKLRAKIGSGEVGRFDQRNTMYMRPRDPEKSDGRILDIGKRHYSVKHFRKTPGYTMRDWAFSMSMWYMERWWGFGNMTGNEGLFTWFPDEAERALRDRMEPGEKWEVSDPEEMSRNIKKAALYIGASLVGICKLDRRWLYSHSFHPQTHKHVPVEIPEEFQYAIVMAHEMPYELMQTSPALGGFSSTGRGYSMMAFVASSLAHYIRSLGYKAIPTGNDTALSVPIAIDAGLGELGRNGMLITEKFGPRVRLSKIFTNLPLVPDKPVEFGVTGFCRACKRCAEECPGVCISFCEPTIDGPTISNNNGIYKWYIDPEKCLDFWARNNGSCSNCVRVCSYNKQPGKLHDTARFLIKHASWLNPVLVGMDKFVGYGSRVKTEEAWK